MRGDYGQILRMGEKFLDMGLPRVFRIGVIKWRRNWMELNREATP